MCRRCRQPAAGAAGQFRRDMAAAGGGHRIFGKATRTDEDSGKLRHNVYDFNFIQYICTAKSNKHVIRYATGKLL